MKIAPIIHSWAHQNENNLDMGDQRIEKVLQNFLQKYM